MWAEGARLDDAQSQRKPVDQDVEEASPDEAKKDDEDYLFHGIVGALTSPL